MAWQIRRGASSIPSNIAEGCGREGDSELARFRIVARGSASELEYQLLLARDLKIIQPTGYKTLLEQTVEIKRMLTARCHSLPAISCFCLAHSAKRSLSFSKLLVASPVPVEGQFDNPQYRNGNRASRSSRERHPAFRLRPGRQQWLVTR